MVSVVFPSWPDGPLPLLTVFRGNRSNQPLYLLKGKIELSSPSALGMFQDYQWMPETADSTKPYIYYLLSYMYMPMTKFL